MAKEKQREVAEAVDDTDESTDEVYPQEASSTELNEQGVERGVNVREEKLADESTELAHLQQALSAGLEEREISREELAEEIAGKEAEIRRLEAVKKPRTAEKRRGSLAELKKLDSLANQIQVLERNLRELKEKEELTRLRQDLAEGLEEREISREELAEAIADKEAEIRQLEAAKKPRTAKKRRGSLIELKELASLANQIQEIEARKRTEHSRKSVRDKPRLEPHRWREPSPEKREPSTPGIFQDRSGDSRRQTAGQEQKLTSEDKQQLNQLLTHVIRAEQNEAETLLKANSDLARYKGDITDLSERIFEDITAFQYAWWAKDYFMCQMMGSNKYLDPIDAAKQIQEWENHPAIRQHGQHFDFKPLDSAYQTYIDKYDGWVRDQREKHWCKVIGGAQRLLPAHVLQEYTTPDRPFYPVPDFTQSRCSTHPTIGVDWCLTTTYNGGKLGEKWGVARSVVVGECYMTGGNALPEKILPSTWADRRAVQALNNTRTTQLDSLRQELLESQRQPTFGAQ